PLWGTGASMVVDTPAIRLPAEGGRRAVLWELNLVRVAQRQSGEILMRLLCMSLVGG
ncbi:hypothetical protein LCGC14_2335230, partial [marine sediment metagenome]